MNLIITALAVASMGVQGDQKSLKYMVHPGGYQFEDCRDAGYYSIYYYLQYNKPKHYPRLRSRNDLIHLLDKLDPKRMNHEHREQFKKDILDKRFSFEFNLKLDRIPVSMLKNDSIIFWIHDKTSRIYEVYYVKAGKPL